VLCLGLVLLLSIFYQHLLLRHRCKFQRIFPRNRLFVEKESWYDNEDNLTSVRKKIFVNFQKNVTVKTIRFFPALVQIKFGK